MGGGGVASGSWQGIDDGPRARLTEVALETVGGSGRRDWAAKGDLVQHMQGRRAAGSPSPHDWTQPVRCQNAEAQGSGCACARG